MTPRWPAVGVVAVLLLRATLGAQLGDPTHDTTTADVPGLTAASSACRASADETYGSTRENPIKVGGGDAYMASRQVKYLSALRGPAGEGVHFKRGATVRASDGTLIDAYTVEIKGGKAIALYIDGYHWADPMSPVGFLCGVAMNLAPPGPDPFETTQRQMTIAVGLGAGEVSPISLDPDGSRLHGVVYDRPRLIGLAAKAALASGTPLDPQRLPREVSEPRLIVIALPLICGPETIRPESLALADGRGTQPPSSGKAAGAAIADLAAGMPSMPDAIAVAYSVPALIAGARVTVHYATPCNGTQDVVLPVRITPAHVVTEAPAPPVSGKTVLGDGARVVLQLFVAPDGTALYPVFAGGAYDFTDAALESLKQWRFEPARVNGAPLIQPEQVMVVVK
jgi:hypothetical protein